MLRKSFAVSILLAGLFLAGCKKDAVRVELSNICSSDNEKKYVVTSGYLDAGGAVYCSNTGGRMDCSLDMIASPGGKRVFGAEIEEGSGASEIEKLPSGYKKEDIKIHYDNGSIVNLSDKVTLTGQMSIAPDGSVCFMEVDKIEK